MAPPVSCCFSQQIGFHTQPLHWCPGGFSLIYKQITQQCYMTHMGTHLYFTSALLFFFPFTLLQLLLAGRLVQTLPVWHNYHTSANRIYYKMVQYQKVHHKTFYSFKRVPLDTNYWISRSFANLFCNPTNNSVTHTILYMNSLTVDQQDVYLT